MKPSKATLVAFLCLQFMLLDAQTPFAGLELTGQGNLELQQYFDMQAERQVYYFEDLEASLRPNQATKGFFKQVDEVWLSEGLESVWTRYSHASHETAWETRHLDFSLMFSRSKSELSFPKDQNLYMDTDQIVLINLSFLNGRLNLPIGFEITRIDTIEKCIEFSYLLGNKAEGKQILEFVDDRRDGTIIYHSSYYHSHSLLRDLFVYPFFHRMITREFHQKMKQKPKKK